MAVLREDQTYADFAHRWIVESVWPFIGGVVQTGLAKLEAEGFTHTEALIHLEALTHVQLHRLGFRMPPVSRDVYIPEPKVYTEQEIMALLAAGETIPQTEYTGFEGTH
jgi:hypothetical protein